MVELIKKVDKKTGDTELVVDKRTLPKKNNPPNVKSLKYARNLPVMCDDCPYRAKEAGGNGLCSKYKADSACLIRKDIAALVDKFNERDSSKIVNLMEAEYHNNFEKLMFFQSLEDMSNTLNPEVTKRINAMTNLGKIINEIKTKRESIEVTKTETLSDDMKTQIAQTIKIEKETTDEP